MQYGYPGHLIRLPTLAVAGKRAFPRIVDNKSFFIDNSKGTGSAIHYIDAILKSHVDLRHKSQDINSKCPQTVLHIFVGRD